MALIGMHARNHPQQVAKRVDDRATDPRVFEGWHHEFGFTVDVAASAANTKCERFYTREQNGLAQSWSGERVWCNPPYSDLEPWIRKAWHAIENEGAELVVMLVPANRTEQRFWQRLIEPHRDQGGPLSVRFLPGRLRFLRPGEQWISPGSRPPFGCCLLVWRAGPA